MKPVELSEDQARRLCATTARQLYALGRVYPGVLSFAYSTTSADVKVSGGQEANPTADLALDVSRAKVRSMLPAASARILLAAAAAAEALEMLQRSDRLAGETVGHTGSWTKESADAAEERSTARRHARRGARA